MPERPSSKLLIAGPARRDIAAIVRWSLKEFGQAASSRYTALIAQALRDIAANPELPGSKERPELMIQGARTYHLSFSRDHVSGDRVKVPRHFVLYRLRPGAIIEVGRILHDTRDLKRHLPEEYLLPRD